MNVDTHRISQLALCVAGAAALFAGVSTQLSARSEEPVTADAAALAGSQIVAMRRLTEAQYRNTIADIFGPDIKVAGRFEPIVRPVHELIASGARESSISPAGIEQFDAIARSIAEQVFAKDRYAQFVPCTPANPAQADPSCAAATLKPLATYLFRRPISEPEAAMYVKMAGEAAKSTGSFYDGLQLALSAMLVSPKFLYVTEIASPDPKQANALVLDGYSKAARLSFTLWNSTPNQNLIDAAHAGKLNDDAQLATIAQAMVRSPRFEEGVRAFFADMLLFERFDQLSKDPLIFPRFNGDVAQAMPEQMLRTIVDHLVTRDGDYRQLFTTNRTFMTRALGGLYQVPVAKSSGWEPHDFADGADRAGILGQAGFLAMYSQSGRSSPTLRGRAIRELLMCQPVPDPPGNVNFTAVQDTGNTSTPTARIRLNAHMTDENCAGCHKLTDPVGLTLERFDGIGSFRTVENGTQIDPSGEMDNLKFMGAEGLGKALAKSPDVTMCVASRALEYARGVPSDADGDLVEAVEKDFGAKNYGIRALFLNVMTKPEAYRVKSPVLQPATRVSLLSK